MLAEAEARQDDSAPYRPPMATYSSEVEMLTAVADEIRLMRYALERANGSKQSSPPPMYPRPYTAMEKARVDRRETRHKSLVARMLPHKKPTTP